MSRSSQVVTTPFSASLCNLLCMEMRITAVAPTTINSKRELPDSCLHLSDVMVDSNHQVADVMGWSLATMSTPPAVSKTPSTAASTPDSANMSSFPSKRLSWTRRLVITKQPASEFYKDEGGKANALEVEVTLVEFNELGEPARSLDKEFIDIPLRILLFFESGKRVDDTDQEIFRFVGNDYDSIVIRASSRKALVQFRLEKVSRRKDGQRFKLRIEVDQEQCTANVADLTPVFTNAICVLSKRKHPSSYNSDSSIRAKEPPPKLLKRDLTSLEDRMSLKIDGLAAQLHHLNQLLQKQNELIAKHQHTAYDPPPINHCSPNDSSILEWLLRSNTAEDGSCLKPALEPHLLPSSVMPFFEILDDSYHGIDADFTSVLVPPSAKAITTSSDTQNCSAPSKLLLPFGDD